MLPLTSQTLTYVCAHCGERVEETYQACEVLANPHPPKGWLALGRHYWVSLYCSWECLKSEVDKALTDEGAEEDA